MATAVCVTLLALVAISTAQNGVSIRFMGQELTPGISRVCLSHIGELSRANASDGPDTVEGTALVCVTNNPNCCRPVDHPGTGTIGEWTIRGFPALQMNAVPPPRIYTNRGTGLVRINYRPNVEGADLNVLLTGQYCCTIPDLNGVNQRLCVDVIDVNNDTMCNLSVSTTAVQSSPTTTTNDGTTTFISTTGPPDTTTLIVPPITGPNTGAVVGGIIGALLAIILVVVIVIVLVCLLTKRKKTNVTEVETFQTAMLQTENKQTVSDVYYTTIGESSITDGAVYAEIDKSHKTKRDTKSRSPAGNGSATDGDLADMYAVPDKKPYVNQPPKSVAPQADAEYAEIDKKDALPRVPQKSAQLEEYLETKPIDQFIQPNSGYSEIGALQHRPKANTLQSLSKPLTSTEMRENPLYDVTAVVRSSTISGPNAVVFSDNVYADPNEPAPKASNTESENIYETIYSEAIQPSHFKTPAPLATPQSTQQEEDLCPYSSIYTLPAAPLTADEKPLIVTNDNIQQVQNLGTGNFGKVVLAKTVGLSLKQLKMSKIDTDTNVKVYVAVKMLKEKPSSSIKEAFEKECKFMSRLNHPSVIRLLGVCTEDTPFIMMEYMEKGDLNQYLKNFDTITLESVASGKVITVANLVYISTQIASGMEYLARQNFVHRDLATRNCLVGQNNTVKIADFGMSRNLYESHYYIIQGHAILPIRWMASECFYGTFSAKSDVWAYGVTMWEVFTLAKDEPYSEMTDGELVEDAASRGSGRKLLQRPEACPVDVFRVMEECWVHEPKERDTFEDIFAHLSSLNFKYSSH